MRDRLHLSSGRVSAVFFGFVVVVRSGASFRGSSSASAGVAGSAGAGGTPIVPAGSALIGGVGLPAIPMGAAALATR